MANPKLTTYVDGIMSMVQTAEDAGISRPFYVTRPPGIEDEEWAEVGRMLPDDIILTGPPVVHTE